jgi:flagellar hook assembly protein FlgD
LLSNSITDITINESGEVFFGTSQGVISYRSESVTPTQDLKEVVVFPNPVRESYEGAIAIRGLVENSSVKITDISGNLVYTTMSEGGQALWNGRNFNGDRVKTGVYLVYVTNSDGSKTTVTKIMFVN